MTKEDVDRLRLAAGDARDSATGQPSQHTVMGLPPHLRAEIRGGQSGYKFYLQRNGDAKPYDQQSSSPSAEAAFEALKRLLTWGPV